MELYHFKVGDSYYCSDLYGGHDWGIKITGRDEKKGEIHFTYDENTSDKREEQTVPIDIVESTAILPNGKEYPHKTEQIKAWEYQSPYAKNGETDIAYFKASDPEISKFYRIERAKELWESLADVPLDPTGEYLDADWNQFPQGTPKEDVWHWFENVFQISVADDLMYAEEEREDL